MAAVTKLLRSLPRHGYSYPSHLPVLVLFSSSLSRSSAARSFGSAITESGPATENEHDDDNEAWQRLNEASRQLADQILRDDDDKEGRDNSSWSSPWWVRRSALSRAITLAESRAWHKQEQAGWLLTHLLRHPVARRRRNSSFRLGIAGAPGAGKSTFIEALGKYLLDQPQQPAQAEPSTPRTTTAAETPPPPSPPESRWVPRRMAVVCVDPTSARSGGSILGDKTRMPALSGGGQYGPRSYVRPAPSGAGTLGGLSTYTHDVVTLCQVANYDLVVVETVGLGQSEVEVEQAVDMLLLLVPPAGGDDLQGVKKGIVEVADLLVVTKADGSLKSAARQTAADYKRAMPFVHGFLGSGSSSLPGWEQPPVLLVSSASGEGLDEAWEKVADFRRQLLATGMLERKRQSQDDYWMWKHLQHLVQWQLSHHPHPPLQRQAEALQRQLRDGRVTPRVAASQLLDLVWHNPPPPPSQPQSSEEAPATLPSPR